VHTSASFRANRIDKECFYACMDIFEPVFKYFFRNPVIMELKEYQKQL
jgi:hypothetical protein